MKAILLAAGFGTRLRPLTLNTPKCLVEINGKPLLGYWLDSLLDAGISDILINTHYLSEQVVEFLASDPRYGKVSIFHEDSLMGTLGTLRATQSFWQGDDLMVIHADNYCRCDWRLFFRAFEHRPDDCMGTMVLFETDCPEHCGIVELDNSGRVIAFHEKVERPPSNLANGAVYLFDAELVTEISMLDDNKNDLSLNLIPHLIGKLNSWKIEGYLRDIGNPHALLKAQDTL